MLECLTIRNYTLLVDVEIPLGPGLNILTGETGAGKSIIIDALGTILGERVDTTVIRDKSQKAVIEGKFIIKDNEPLKNYLKAQDIDYDDEILILRREILDQGRSRAFINDTPVPLSTLQDVGNLLVDLHGQHEHQSLFKTQKHLEFLDDFGHLDQELNHVAQTFKTLKQLRDQKHSLEEQAQTLKEKREFYEFQLNEIQKVNPVADEEEALLAEEKILKNSELLFRLTSEFYQILYESENSVHDQLSRVMDGLTELKTIDPRFENYVKDCQTTLVTVDEISKFLQSYNSNIEFNPERLEEIQGRLAQLSSLKKKYGPTLAEVLKYRDKIKNELEAVENLDDQLLALEKEIAKVEEEFSQACANLSDKRKRVAAQLEELVPQVLSVLGMNGTRFKVEIKQEEDSKGLAFLNGKRYRASARGIDSVEFYISTNPGEPLKPLVKVASGGEISRIMLALKSIIAQGDNIPVLIFDEIDLGISGKIAQAVGKKLKDLAQYHQIICITHLPQIASMGNQHFLVEKYTSEGKTQTKIRKLDQEERTRAIAMLLAGEKISETHLQSARELLADSAMQ
ncbi:MAG: DNA repair protein RecN [Calditrichaeota bacterium]|nr:MAG: DNA repair protein RecN [Calditrichota bacterium]